MIPQISIKTLTAPCITKKDTRTIEKIEHLIKVTFDHEYTKDALEILEKVNTTAIAGFDTSKSLVACAITERKADYLEIAYIATARKYRRRGIATQLMREVFLRAKKLNVKVTLQYNCLKSSRVKFYESFHPEISDKRDVIMRLLIPFFAEPVFNPKQSLQSISQQVSTRRNNLSMFHVIRIIHTMMLTTIFLYTLTYIGVNRGWISNESSTN